MAVSVLETLEDKVTLQLAQDVVNNGGTADIFLNGKSQQQEHK